MYTIYLTENSNSNSNSLEININLINLFENTVIIILGAYNNEIHISKNKGDIYNLSEIIISSASKDEILNNEICSLNGKDYNKKELICGYDFRLVKLGELCKFLPKSKR